jgi:hypothetical protein
VESKRKGLNVSVKRACELIVEEAKARRAGAPKVVRETLDKTQKYLHDAGHVAAPPCSCRRPLSARSVGRGVFEPRVDPAGTLGVNDPPSAPRR